MSDEKRDELVEKELNTPETATEETANWDLGTPEAEVAATDLLSPAVEEENTQQEKAADTPAEVTEPVVEPSTSGETAGEELAVDAPVSETPVVEETVSEDVVSEAPLADVFLSKEESDAADIPRDVLALRSMPDPEPTRRSFDFSKLNEADTNAETVESTPAAEETAASGDSAPTAETLVIEEASPVEAETEVSRKEIFEQAKAEAEEAVSAWKPREDDAPVSDNTAALVLSNTSVPLVVPSRLGARLWSFFMTLLGAPVVWYLLSDGAARFTLSENSPYQTGVLNVGALVEFGAGVILAVVILGFLVRSSLGALFTGLVLLTIGTVFIAIPGLTKDFLAPAIQWLKDWNDFGANVAHHINWTGYTGAIFLAGLMLFVMGIVAILARRDGRKETEIRNQIERYAPQTAKK
ncbi:hypothetical protein NXS08_04505 [Gleimia sp. 6138-11-ORH1]|uniref:hypothetical protein n=1 Tax=Gleimia sp. 6138-11-ORH1 TaxID=2973937 RepID=UPI002168A408|nr:hypothetical protein [Gleimia sp. 6138-11-ORH1]MCS4484740.1 hypothetical protein [Gleimia sp. 6138-11-ORH1]